MSFPLSPGGLINVSDWNSVNRSANRSHVWRMVSADMGISNILRGKIRNYFIKGISGVEKKRLLKKEIRLACFLNFFQYNFSFKNILLLFF